MKQHVTPKQVFSLSKNAYEKYLDYFRKMVSFVGTLTYFEPLNGGKEMLPCMSIGQMIEFMKDNRTMMGINWYLDKENVCDRLWEMVKKVLERK